jgi:hypothetical protein
MIILDTQVFKLLFYYYVKNVKFQHARAVLNFTGTGRAAGKLPY